MCRLRFATTSVLAPKMRVTGSSSSFAKYLPVRGPCTVRTTHLSFCGASVLSGSRPSSHRLSDRSLGRRSFEGREGRKPNGQLRRIAINDVVNTRSTFERCYCRCCSVCLAYKNVTIIRETH